MEDKLDYPDLEMKLWSVLDENTRLQQENYYLKIKMKEIQRIVGNYDIYE